MYGDVQHCREDNLLSLMVITIVSITFVFNSRETWPTQLTSFLYIGPANSLSLSLPLCIQWVAPVLFLFNCVAFPLPDESLVFHC